MTGNRAPPHAKARCSVCGWIGELGECSLDVYQEDYEHPELLLEACPVCGEFVDI